MMIENLGVASVAAITVLCYIAGAAIKACDKVDDKHIPAIMGLLGIVLGLLAYVIHMPDFPAQDVITAAAVGAVSGWAATGINQMFKQIG